MRIAYVFTHAPEVGADRTEYERRLVAFHDALAARPPAGFVDSWVWQLGSGPVGDGFQDWYLVEDWAAIGRLAEAAVSGPRRAPHDASAAMAGSGAGAIYGLVSAAISAGAQRRLRVDKPRGVPYADFEAELLALPGATVWKRQLVLGADREYLVDLRDTGDTGDTARTLSKAAGEAVALQMVSGPRG